MPEGREKYFCPPVFDSAPGAEHTRGGAENLCIPKAFIRTFHTSFLTTIDSNTTQIKKEILYSKTGFKRSF